MSQPTLQLVGIGASDGGQMEGKGVPQVMGSQWRDMTRGVAELGIMPAPDLLEDQVDGPR